MADTLDLFDRDLPAAVERGIADGAEWPAILDELTDYFLDELQRAAPELGEAKHRLLAMRLVTRFVSEYGGSRPYIPKDDQIRRALVRLRVWSEYDGRPETIQTLARRYKITDVCVYGYIRRERKRYVERVQVDGLKEIGR